MSTKYIQRSMPRTTIAKISLVPALSDLYAYWSVTWLMPRPHCLLIIASSPSSVSQLRASMLS